MISLISNSNIYNQPSFGAKLSVVLSSNPLKMKADEFLKNGNFDKAIEYYKAVLAQSPDDSEVNLSLAKTYTYNNQYKQAIPHLENYLKARPDDIENITLLGECCKKSGMFSKSIEHFNKALAIEPSYDYARRNLLDAQNLQLACYDPQKAKQERYNTAIKNLTEAVKIAKQNLPKGYTDNMKDIVVSFDKTSKMGGRANIAQYEHSKRKVSVTDEYTYADPQLTGAYVIHEFVHGKDNDPYTSIREEQDAYRVQAKYWVDNVKNIYDPEMDYVADLYKQSAKALDDRVAEIYRLRDPGIPETSYNHSPTKGKAAAFSLSSSAGKPLKAYEIIV